MNIVTRLNRAAPLNRTALRVYRKNLIVGALALTVIGSYLVFQPFIVFDPSRIMGGNFTPPEGVELPADVTLPQGGSAPQGGAAPQDNVVPQGEGAPQGMPMPPQGAGNFTPPTMNDDGSITLPPGFPLPEGAALPEGAVQNDDGSITLPPGSFPNGAMMQIPAGAMPMTGATATMEAPASDAAPQQPAQAESAPGVTGEAPNLPQLTVGGATLGSGGPFNLDSPLRPLVLVGGVAALALALLSAWKPRLNGTATVLTFIGGVAGLAYYIAFFVQDALLPLPISLTTFANPGFWVALVGSAGLALQIFIPRPHEADADDSSASAILDAKSLRRGGLGLRQNLAVAMDALLANKLRSALTMLGVIIGVGSVVALLSVGQGAQSSITEQIGSTGVNLITVTSGLNVIGPGGGGGGGGGTETLTYDDAEAIAREVDDITAVLPQYSASFTIRGADESYGGTALGTTHDYADANSIAVEIGRYFTEREYRGNQRVAVLGSAAAEELFGSLNPIGEDIRIDNQRFEVIGVLAEQDGGFGQDPNLQVYIPLTTGYRYLFDARARGSSSDVVSSIVVAAASTDAATVDAVTQQIEAVLREQHGLEADEDNDFSVIDQQQLLDTAGSITGILTVLLGAIASISLVVGGIGIMNISLVSVTERTKEIGLRKAIGARRGHILQQFLIETTFLSLLGGLIGVAVGVGIALAVDASGLISTTISPTSIALGLGSSIIIGIFFGVYPANQAAALEPIEALRYE